MCGAGRPRPAFTIEPEIFLVQDGPEHLALPSVTAMVFAGLGELKARCKLEQTFENGDVNLPFRPDHKGN